MQRIHIAGLLSILALATSPALADFPNMAAAVPKDANVLMLVDFNAIGKSDLAVKNDFKNKYQAMYDAGIMTMPPDTALGLVAAQIDLEFVRPLWELGVVELNRAPSLSHIAKVTKGTLDSVGGVDAVRLTNDAYLVQLNTDRMAVMSPANRQNVGRWLADIRERKAVALSPYLRQAMDAVTKEGAEIVQVLDFEYALKLPQIRANLENAESLKNKTVDKDKLAQLLAGMKGVILKIRIDAKVHGAVTIDFSDDTAILNGIGKALLMETLESRGAAIEDLASWKVQPQGTQLLLEGDLTPLGLRKVFSLIEMPNPHVEVAASSASSPAASPESLIIAATKKYYAGVTTILTDGRSQWKDSKSTGQNAMWLDKWARKVDSLPILNVDEEMVKYGQATSDKLRDMALAIRGGDIRSSARKSQVYQQTNAVVGGVSAPAYGGYRYGWGGGYFETNDVGSERRAIGAQERATANSAVVQRASEINAATGQIRKMMVDKYKVEF